MVAVVFGIGAARLFDLGDEGVELIGDVACVCALPHLPPEKGDGLGERGDL